MSIALDAHSVTTGRARFSRINARLIVISSMSKMCEDQITTPLLCSTLSQTTRYATTVLTTWTKTRSRRPQLPLSASSHQMQDWSQWSQWLVLWMLMPRPRPRVSADQLVRITTSLRTLRQEASVNVVRAQNHAGRAKMLSCRVAFRRLTLKESKHQESAFAQGADQWKTPSLARPRCPLDRDHQPITMVTPPKTTLVSVKMVASSRLTWSLRTKVWVANQIWQAIRHPSTVPHSQLVAPLVSWAMPAEQLRQEQERHRCPMLSTWAKVLNWVLQEADQELESHLNRVLTLSGKSQDRKASLKRSKCLWLQLAAIREGEARRISKLSTFYRTSIWSAKRHTLKLMDWDKVKKALQLRAELMSLNWSTRRICDSSILMPTQTWMSMCWSIMASCLKCPASWTTALTTSRASGLRRRLRVRLQTSMRWMKRICTYMTENFMD